MKSRHPTLESACLAAVPFHPLNCRGVENSGRAGKELSDLTPVLGEWTLALGSYSYTLLHSRIVRCSGGPLVCSVAITKDHRLDGLSDRRLFSHSCGGRKSKIKVPVGLLPREASLLGL